MARKPKDNTKYEAICNGCNKPYQTTRYKLENGKKFCSLQCRWQKPELSPRKNKQRRVTITCDNCKKEFQALPSKVKKGRKFCSHLCSNSSRARGIVDIKCPGCNNVFTVQKSVAEKGKKYCSMKCYRVHITGQPRVYKKAERLQEQIDEQVKRPWAKPLPLFGIPK